MKKKKVIIIVLVIVLVGIVLFAGFNIYRSSRYNKELFVTAREAMYELDGGESEPIILCINNIDGASYMFTDKKIINSFVSSIEKQKFMEISENEYNEIKDMDADSLGISIGYPKSEIYIQLSKEELLVNIGTDQNLFDMDFNFVDEEWAEYYGRVKNNDRNLVKIVEKFLEKNTSYITIEEIKKIALEENIKFENFGVFINSVYAETSPYNVYSYPVKDTEYTLKVRCSPAGWSVSGVKMEFNGEIQTLKGSEMRYDISDIWLFDKNGNKINLLENKDIDGFISNSR